MKVIIGFILFAVACVFMFWGFIGAINEENRVCEQNQVTAQEIDSETQKSIDKLNREIAHNDSVLVMLKTQNEKLRQMNAKADEMIKKMKQ